MTVGKNSANVLLSFLEYRFFFKEPIFEAWSQQGLLTSSIFRAFREWNVGLEHITRKQNPSNASESQLTVELLKKKFFFNFGLGTANLIATNPNWDDADLIMRIASAGVEVMRVTGKAEIDKQLLSLAFHIKPEGQSIRDITSQFVQLGPDITIGEDVRAFGFSVYRKDRDLVVDLSGLFPEALFIRLTRTFAAQSTFQELAKTLRNEEDQVLGLLGLRID